MSFFFFFLVFQPRFDPENGEKKMKKKVLSVFLSFSFFFFSPVEPEAPVPDHGLPPRQPLDGEAPDEHEAPACLGLLGEREQLGPQGRQREVGPRRDGALDPLFIFLSEAALRGLDRGHELRDVSLGELGRVGGRVAVVGRLPAGGAGDWVQGQDGALRVRPVLRSRERESF